MRASPVPLKFDPNEIKVVYMRWGSHCYICPGPKITPLGLSPKKAGDDIIKATSD